MAGYAANEILAPQAILDRFSRIEFPGTTLSRIFGWNISSFAGANPTGAVVDHPLRSGQYDIMDVSRRVATARAPGTPSSMQKPQFVGSVQFTIPRSAETIPLLDERLQNQRQLGATANVIDRGGLRYIQDQEMYLGQRFANMIEFQTAAMLRGSYTFTQKGDDAEQTFSGGEVTINFKIPAGNLTTLDMTGAGAIIGASLWSTTTNDIPGQLQSINSAFVNLTGQGLAHVIVSGVGWQYVVNNTKVQAQGGTANVVFERLERVSAGEFTAVLRGIPWVTWHVVDYGLEVWDGSAYTFTKLIPDNKAVFIPEPNPGWVEYIRGGEWVTEGPNGQKTWQYGFYPFSYPTHEPSGVNLSAVFNGLPSLKRPKAIAYGSIAA